MLRGTCARALLAFVSMAVLPATASAYIEEDNRITTSFDGTKIVSKLFLPDGASASSPVPVILRTHGWAGSRETSATGTLKTFLDEGYAVLTWDQRGFGQSGGHAEVNSPDFEAKDVSAMIDGLAADARIATEAPGDPLIGMSGGSYAGGIQFMTAATDSRVDAIAPEIAWNNLLESLIPDGVVKLGWDLLLYGTGTGTGTALGLAPNNPAGPSAGSVSPMLHRAFVEGGATGDFSPEVREYFGARGADTVLEGVEVPAFIIQATTDTLFPPSQAIDNFETLAAEHPGGALKMQWYCGGHGVCSPFVTPPRSDTDARIVTWFDRHVKGDAGVDTGPRFVFADDEGDWQSASDYPVPGTSSIGGSGAGIVSVNGEPTAGGVMGPSATAGRTSLEVPLTGETAGTTLIGEPTVTVTATGVGTAADNLLAAPLFFQLVNKRNGHVIGNQITPKLIPTDGAQHTLSFPIEAVAYQLDEGDEIVLQVVSSSLNYEAYRGAAAINLESIQVSVPVR
ncbi:MAG TPA: alpha/beta fold hydrolase [Thermoleophilaceae bacterium]|nr:alpha/beta fold hydrolase [Thermoleophilaceae bacterium]